VLLRFTCQLGHNGQHPSASVQPRCGQHLLTSTESKFSRVTIELVRESTVLLMCCSSHVTGTRAASKIFFTAAEISGPTPEAKGD
jgi:hypothetical protein